MKRLTLAGFVSVLLILVSFPVTVTATPERPDRGNDRPRPHRTPRPDRSDRPERTPRPDRPPEPSGPEVAWLVPPRADITVGYEDPGVLGQAPLLIASLAGYFEDAGFDSVRIVEVSDPLTALRAADVDFAVVDTNDAADAVATDPAGPRPIAGYHATASDDGDMLLAAPGLVADEPSTAVAFLSAYIRALQDLSTPESSAAALALIEGTDLAIDPELADGWDEAVAAFGPFDGGFGPADDEGGLGALATFLQGAGITPADPEALVDEAPVNLAQSQLGLDPNPASDLVGAPILAEVSVGLTGGESAGGPIAAAATGGHFTDAGFTAVAITDVEQPLAGLTLGELDFAVLPATEAADAVAQGLPIVAIAGHRNYGADGAYGGDVLVTTADLLTSEGPTVAAFLDAYILGLRDLETNDDAATFAPLDGGFGDRAQGGGLGELTAYVTDALGSEPDLGALIAAGPLTFAQAGLGLPANPTVGAPDSAATTGEEATS